MKIDPYKHKERWFKWKESLQGQIPEVSKENSDVILQYLNDMENGVNVSLASKKGARSYTRLNTLRNRLLFLAKDFEGKYDKSLVGITESDLTVYFTSMRNGNIKRKDGKNYRCVKDFAKTFKAFWHWWQKVCSKDGETVQDITQYLDTTGEKPKWVYLSEEQVKLLCENAKYNYKALMMFLFDSGIRAPTELINIRVSDLSADFKELKINDEISKTFGRRIKLMICSDLLKEYVRIGELKPSDQLFSISPYVVNRYLKRLGKKVFGDVESPAGEKYSEITMYDFRHCSCCYWLPRYKSESALKYRFGWKKSDKIHYYSELLGMRDTITEDDLLVDITKTEIEKRLAKSENKCNVLEEEVGMLRGQMKKILFVTNKLYGGVVQVLQNEV